jgi:hypothetical protein
MTNEPSRAVKLCGTEDLDPPSRLLTAGQLSAELENGQLRYVTYAGIEVIRGIAFLVRDENWGTYTPKIGELSVQEKAAEFVVTYRAACAGAAQKLVYDARISGRRDGSLSFEVVAMPETDVITNRTGFVVLHPAALAGRPVRVTRVNGDEVDARFPDGINPSQPIFDIRALTHEASPGLWATCRMEGDAFEMEDQRNWGDASYKTYVRPLSLPWGYTLAKGSRHEQSVRLTFSGRTDRGARKGGGHLTVALGAELMTRMPAVGVGLPAEETGAALAVIDSLRSLAPNFLVCTIDARTGRGLDALDAYRQIGETVGAAIVMEIVIPDESDPAAVLASVAAAVAAARLKSDAVIVSTESDLKSWQPGVQRPERPTVEEICRAARAAFPHAKLGGGMLSYFTELNRKPPKAKLVDFVSHTTCSIVHAADDRSVMETLETLPAIIASTRAMIGQTPYRIGPSAIASRSNPYGKGVASNLDNGRVCLTDSDPRQRGLFNAAWTLGYVAACANGGLQAVAMGSATGRFGFIHSHKDHTAPYFGQIDRPTFYPAFHVMAGLGHGYERPLISAKISEPRRLAALAWSEDRGPVLWLANLTSQQQTLRIFGETKPGARLGLLDAASFARAVFASDALDDEVQSFAGKELTLDAYAVARID